MTTIENVKPAQIQALRAEAVQAGDSEQVALCDRAIRTSPYFGAVVSDDIPAVRRCVEALNAARAQQELDEDDDSDPVDHGLEHDYDEYGP